jgi:NAD(P)-dependent dehydrogenase (short-subunit alcohol dehydrogenase family)
VLGIALGAAIETGAALLLFTGRGFLGTAGFLISLSLAALALGLWVGAESTSPLRRWIHTILAFAAAGVFVSVWRSGGEARVTGFTGALAALFLLAEPAYTSGATFGSIANRARGSAAAAAFGAAFGILTAALIMIPRLPPSVIFLSAAAALTLAATWDVSQAANPRLNNNSVLMNKVALITGVGHRGQVGYAVAQQLLAAGARVCITDVAPAMQELAGELGENATAKAADLTNEAAVKELMEHAYDRFGRLDVVVNVAGGLSVIKPLAETATDEWRREMQRNAETAFMVCRAALPMLREARGSIINFASPAAVRAQAQLGAYSAAKAAVVAMTRALAIEEKDNGVRANAIAPGMIDTEQNRKSVADPDNTKWVSREQIADVVIFLASDASRGVTGETIHVLGEGIA